MTDTNVTSYTQYNPARSNSFTFTVSGHRDLSFKIQNSAVAGVQLGSTQFATAYADLTIPSNKLTFDPLQLKFLVSENIQEWIDVFSWMLDLSKNADLTESAELTILSSQNVPLVRFIYKSIWPLALGDIQYTTVGDEEVATCDVSMVFDTFDIEIISTGVKIIHGE